MTGIFPIEAADAFDAVIDIIAGPIAAAHITPHAASVQGTVGRPHFIVLAVIAPSFFGRMLGNGFIAPMQFRFPGSEEGPAVTEGPVVTEADGKVFIHFLFIGLFFRRVEVADVAVIVDIGRLIDDGSRVFMLQAVQYLAVNRHVEGNAGLSRFFAVGRVHDVLETTDYLALFLRVGPVFHGIPQLLVEVDLVIFPLIGLIVNIVGAAFVVDRSFPVRIGRSRLQGVGAGHLGQIIRPIVAIETDQFRYRRRPIEDGVRRMGIGRIGDTRTVLKGPVSQADLGILSGPNGADAVEFFPEPITGDPHGLGQAADGEVPLPDAVRQVRFFDALMLEAF